MTYLHVARAFFLLGAAFWLAAFLVEDPANWAYFVGFCFSAGAGTVLTLVIGNRRVSELTRRDDRRDPR